VSLTEIGVPTAIPVVLGSDTVTVLDDVLIVIPVIPEIGEAVSYTNGRAPTFVWFSHLEIWVPYSKSVSISACG
jgi:hypothetical protein